MQKSLKGIVLAIMMIQFVCCNLFAQTTPTPAGPTGKISGKVIDKANGETIISAVIKAKNNATGVIKGASTDVDGRYTIKLPVGNYSITFSYPGYVKDSLPSIDVIEGQVKEIDIAIEEKVTTTNTIVITAPVEKENNTFILIERKNAAQVSDGISAETIKKTPDRSTADVLKRVTGASIQDGKFAIIRGMNDRYNAGYLNGAQLPSTESDRKAFAFDVIPANLIDNLQIIKTGSPDLTGDFAGGIIQISTKNIPTTFSQTLSLGGQYNSITTFKTFERMGSESGDILGLYSDSRNIPDVGTSLTNPKNNNSTRTLQVEPSKLFNDDYSVKSANALPNLRFSYSLGAPIKLNDKGSELGVIFAYNYSNTRVFKSASIFKNSFQDNTFLSELKDRNYNLNVTNGGLLNLNYKVTPNNIISFRNTYNANADYTTIFRQGSDDIPANRDLRSYGNVQNFNRLFSNQLAGEHKISSVKLTWLLNRADIKRSIPDYRLTTYLIDKTDPSNVSTSLFTPNLFSQGTGRFWSNLSEKVYSANSDVLVPLNFFGPKIKLEGKTGFLIQNRTRDFKSRNFVYDGSIPNDPSTPEFDLSENNIGVDKLILKEKTIKINDDYNATSNLYAGYAMLDARILQKLRISGGVRIENFKQVLTNEETDKLTDDQGNIRGAKIYDKPAVTSILPSVNVTYSLTEKINLRGSAYKTVNRPEFREIANFSFYNFAINSQFVGNSELKQADINNYDLRFELYPTANQIISIGAFYKKIKNPIEYNIDVTSTDRLFNYGNENEASIRGIELEVRKSFMKRFTVFSNLSLINSKLSFTPGSFSTPNRSLQGQSPYIVNIGLQYENEETGWFASIVGNKNGRRIAFVGAPGRQEFGGDIYERPRTVIDFQVGKEIGKLNLKLTVGDILHQDLLYYINLNDDKNFNEGVDNKLFLNNTGFTTSLTASYKF
ncbi:MAG: hypothetical protein RLZZ175_2958 [Bacteroidota bacterium]|jgi:outer membrane receptor protein involved in Fe transport